jgi:exopolysaccharide production protein ExoQ
MNTPLPSQPISRSPNRGSAAQKASQALPARPNVLLRLLFVIFFVFDIPAFTYQLAFDPVTAQWTGSQLTSITTLLGELFAIVMILRSRETVQMILRCWPIWGPMVLGLVSAMWSLNPIATIDTSIRFIGTALLGLAIAGTLRQFQSVQFVVRVMTLGCILSIAWVAIFPDTSVHQASDPLQAVHAGLWRGIFSHKQGLGLFAGLTTGFLIFYRTSIFPLWFLPIAIGCSVLCLVETQSATGFVATVLTPAFLYVGRIIIARPQPQRKALLLQFATVFVTIALAYEIGLLDFVIVNVLGKSTDLTGRADFWPLTLANFNNSGFSLLGGGFGAGLALDLSEWSVDNGYIDKLLEFGYLTSPFIFACYAAMLIGSMKLLLNSPRESSQVNVFPFGFISVLLILNITESNFMIRSFCTVITSVAVALIVQGRNLQEQSVSAQAAPPRSFQPLSRRLQN